SASLTLSNQLTQAIALDAEQITNLNRQTAEMNSENQALNGQITALTNQVAGLNRRIALTEASLAQTNQDLVQVRKDFTLLENRLRRDVAERLVIQRKFYNPDALSAQMDKLKSYQGVFDVTADQIYAGLDVEVNSNGTFHVLASE
ncbi:MAG TPA: hypothetical protein VFF11_10300, partial [Candidatus Binatia bacterium]|nr:hypothetical protein [Candidatus Binatia bacterium]